MSNFDRIVLEGHVTSLSPISYTLPGSKMEKNCQYLPQITNARGEECLYIPAAALKSMLRMAGGRYLMDAIFAKKEGDKEGMSLKTYLHIIKGGLAFGSDGNKKYEEIVQARNLDLVSGVFGSVVPTTSSVSQIHHATVPVSYGRFFLRGVRTDVDTQEVNEWVADKDILAHLEDNKAIQEKNAKGKKKEDVEDGETPNSLQRPLPSVECIPSGSKLEHKIVMTHPTDHEFGYMLLSLLNSRHFLTIGGRRSIGNGQIALSYLVKGIKHQNDIFEQDTVVDLGEISIQEGQYHISDDLLAYAKSTHQYIADHAEEMKAYVEKVANFTASTKKNGGE